MPQKRFKIKTALKYMTLFSDIDINLCMVYEQESKVGDGWERV